MAECMVARFASGKHHVRMTNSTDFPASSQFECEAIAHAGVAIAAALAEQIAVLSAWWSPTCIHVGILAMKCSLSATHSGSPKASPW